MGHSGDIMSASEDFGGGGGLQYLLTLKKLNIFV